MSNKIWKLIYNFDSFNQWKAGQTFLLLYLHYYNTNPTKWEDVSLSLSLWDIRVWSSFHPTWDEITIRRLKIMFLNWPVVLVWWEWPAILEQLNKYFIIEEKVIKTMTSWAYTEYQEYKRTTCNFFNLK